MIRTGAVDQRIDASPFLGHPLYPFDRGSGIRDITLERGAANAVCFNGVDNFVCLLGAGAITNCDGPASCGQIQSYPASDTSRTTRNQSNFSCHRVFSTATTVHRPMRFLVLAGSQVLSTV